MHFPNSTVSPVVSMCVITPLWLYGFFVRCLLDWPSGSATLWLQTHHYLSKTLACSVAQWSGAIIEGWGPSSRQNPKMEKNPIHRDFSKITLSGVNSGLEISLNRPYKIFQVCLLWLSQAHRRSVWSPIPRLTVHFGWLKCTENIRPKRQFSLSYAMPHVVQCMGSGGARLIPLTA